MKVKAKAIPVAADEIWTEEALNGMVGQVTDAGTIRAASVEDGWVVLTIELSERHADRMTRL